METIRVKNEPVQKEDGPLTRHNRVSVLIVDDRPQSVRGLLEIAGPQRNRSPIDDQQKSGDGESQPSPV